MQASVKLALSMAVVACCLRVLSAQDLAPRAYLITPVRSNAVTVAWSFYDGSIDFNGAVPNAQAKGKYNIPIVSYYHSMNFFGRSANFVGTLPYAVGHFQGTAEGVEANLYRSGLADSVYRFAVNVKGGPAMPAQEFVKWRQKTLLGVSLKVLAPTGQYDPTKLINWGTNRWSFKPELGYSHQRKKLIFDAYAGVWFFTKNGDYWSRNIFFPGNRSQTQAPIGAFEGHVSYDVKPRMWVSLDGNFWFGGKTTVDGVVNSFSEQTNSRIGATASVPITKHQSLKFSYSNGTYIRFGGNYQNVTAAWQYSWIGRPK